MDDRNKDSGMLRPYLTVHLCCERGIQSDVFHVALQTGWDNMVEGGDRSVYIIHIYRVSPSTSDVKMSALNLFVFCFHLTCDPPSLSDT